MRGKAQGRYMQKSRVAFFWVPQPTYLVEELWQLHLHLLPLEHVVLGLLADGWDQVELPGHRVGFLGRQRRGSV